MFHDKSFTQAEPPENGTSLVSAFQHIDPENSKLARMFGHSDCHISNSEKEKEVDVFFLDAQTDGRTE